MRKLRIPAALLLIVMLMLCSVAFADGDNIVKNGDFSEQGTGDLPLGWYSDAFSEEEFTAKLAEIDGNGVAYLSSDIANDARLVQLMTVEPDSYYHFSCKIKTKNVNDECGGANMSVMDSWAVSEKISGTIDWREVSFYGHTDVEQTEIELALRLGFYGGDSTGEVWFDDVSVEKLDEAPDSGTVYELVFPETDENDDDDNGAVAKTENGMPFSSETYIATALMTIAAFLIDKYFIKKKQPELSNSKKTNSNTIWVILLIGLLLRVLANFLFKSTSTEAVYYGHSTDINCFAYWGNAMSDYGPMNFYSSVGFSDYPPGYLYVLWLVDGVRNLFGIAYGPGSAGHALLLKLPAICADLGLAYMLYKLIRRFGKGDKLAYSVACLVALNPLLIFLSGVWGQIDSILALGLVATVLLFVDKKLILAGVVYGATILIKPQALMAGPIIAVAYFVYIFTCEKANRKRAIIDTAVAVLCAVGVIILGCLPFAIKGGWDVIAQKYLGTVTSYDYASIEAFNFMSLIGGNWVKVTDPMFLGISYKIWGWIFMGITFAGSAWLYIKGHKKNKYALLLCAALMLAGFFTFGHYMHERYLFPALLLVIFAAVVYNDRRLYFSFGWLSASMMMNCMAAFLIVDNRAARYVNYGTFVTIGSIMTVVGFLYLAYAAFMLIIKDKPAPAFPLLTAGDNAASKKAKSASAEKTAIKKLSSKEESNMRESILPEPTDNKLHFKKKDTLFVLVLTVVYAVIALFNLGTLSSPETHWEATASSDTVKVDFGKEVEVSGIYVFYGISNSGTCILEADDGNTYSFTQEYGEMFRWTNVSSNLSLKTSGFEIYVDSGKLDVCEFGFFDSDGNVLSATASKGGEALVDEADTVPSEFNYLNGMYFDELYHGRTAYEHLHNLSPYENSHPPLGKIFISIGIAIFGMCPFGWRIVGTLFGIAMVPLLYCFGKRLFKKSEWALLTAFLFTFDFMHFTQTRIATIDVYGLFFILLMFYYMYQYFTMNFYVDGLKKTLKPLALAGVFFGLGISSKWICFYAGGGLALLLLISLLKRYREYREALRNGTERERELTSVFVKNTILTLAWCILFYIILPVAMYVASYIPYFIYNGDTSFKKICDTVWYYQDFMFSYHSGLTATHTYQSEWYKWIFDLRPIWYHRGTTTIDTAQTISAFGNPAVWWTGLAGTLMLAFSTMRRKIKLTPGMTLAFVGIISNLGPWLLVTRCTFIYHYFATVPFIIIASVYMLKYMEEKYHWLSYVKWAWMGLTGLLFAMFYPVISGANVSTTWLELLQWVPYAKPENSDSAIGWTFLGSSGNGSGTIFGVIFILLTAALFIGIGVQQKQKEEKIDAGKRLRR